MTYPKDGEQKLKQENKQLRMQVSRLRKENDILRQELTNIVKPIRPRKQKVEKRYEDFADDKPEVMTKDEWRQKFIADFKPRIDQRLKECKKNEDSENE